LSLVLEQLELRSMLAGWSAEVTFKKVTQGEQYTSTPSPVVKETQTVTLPDTISLPAQLRIVWEADDDLRVNGVALGTGKYEKGEKPAIVTVNDRTVTLQLVDTYRGDWFGHATLCLQAPSDTGGEGEPKGYCSASDPMSGDGYLRFNDSSLGSADVLGPAIGLERASAAVASANSSPFGNGWSRTATPSLTAFGDESNPDTVVALSFGNNDTRVYTRSAATGIEPRFQRANGQGSSDTFTLVNGQYVFHTATGTTYTFNSFTSMPAATRGKMVTREDVNGNRLEQTFNDDGTTAALQYYVGGQPTPLETQKYSYLTVLDSSSSGKVSAIDIMRGDGSLARRMAFTYYASGSPFGASGDLMSASIQDARGNVLDTTRYRYTTVSGATMLSYTFDSEAVRRAKSKGVNLATAINADVAPYATNHYEYYADGRVRLWDKQGAGCSSCAGGIGQFLYSYADRGVKGDTHRDWARKLIEKRPDGSQRTVYTNAFFQPILDVTGMYGNSFSGQYGTYTRYDERGLPLWIASADAVDLSVGLPFLEQYGDLLNNVAGNFHFLRDNSGLITVTEHARSTTADATTPGNVERMVASTSLKRGENGALIKQEAFQYILQPGTAGTAAFVASRTTFPDTSGVNGHTTTFATTFVPGTTSVVSRTTTFPVVTPDENGSNEADAVNQFYDTSGREIWSRDGDGYLKYTEYDAATGAVVKTIVDVNTRRTSDFANLPSGWQTPSNGGLHLTSAVVVDAMGRPVTETDPQGNVTRTVYDDINHAVRVYRGVTFPTPSTWRTTGPIEVSRRDESGTYTEALTFLASASMGSLPMGSEPIANVQSLSRSHFNAAGQVIAIDRYTTLEGISYLAATPTLGAEGVNYLRTRYGYNDQGQVDRVQNPAGTITIASYDGLKRLTGEWVGTNDSTVDRRKWNLTNGSALANMMQVTKYKYDNGEIGNSLLTSITQYAGGGLPEQVTQNVYDWRGRIVITKLGASPSLTDEGLGVNRSLFYMEYDNLGRVTSRRLYDGDQIQVMDYSSIIDINSNGVPDMPVADRLRGFQTIAYDALDRAFHTEEAAVDQATGEIGTGRLTSDIFFDHRGNAVATYLPNNPVTQSRYDGAGRLAASFTLGNVPAATWANATSTAASVVVEQTEYAYDAAGNAILMTNRQRFHDAASTTFGPLGTPTKGIAARVSYTTSYYDAANRLSASVDVGTNGGSLYSRPDLVPARSDTTLVTSYGYADQPSRTIETIGSAVLTVDGSGMLCANGIRIYLAGGGISYDTMAAAGLTAVAADTIAGSNQLVWRLRDGSLHFWQLNSAWDMASGFGNQVPGSVDYAATEKSFSMDLDGNGRVGGDRLIESQGSVSLTVDGSGMLCANGIRIYPAGGGVSFSAMAAAGFTAVAADTIAGGNQLVWRLRDGSLHFWQLNAAWDMASGFGGQVPGSPEYAASERDFGVDFNGDGLSVGVPDRSGLPWGGVSYRDVTDPRGITSRTLTDALGRTTAAIANFTGGVATAQTDVTSAFAFDTAGRLASRTAVQPAGKSSQVTGYVYGVSPTTGSTITSNDILAETRYPDPATGSPSATEADVYTVNALGQRTTFTDRAGTTHTYGYDLAGNRRSDQLTTLGQGTDEGVRRLAFDYDVRGQIRAVTSFGLPTGVPAVPVVLNQVQRAYNGFGQLTSEWQAHTGLVNTGTAPSVTYTYSESSDGNHSRLRRLTYPAGYALNYVYAGIDAALNRPTSLGATKANTTTPVTLEAFKYLGAGTVVERSRPEVDVTLSMVNLSGTAGAAGDKYTGLDRFGRVVDQRWTQGTTATSPVVDRSTYTYDRNGNRLTRGNALATAFSEKYSYDALNQLQSFARTGGTTKTQQWQFDALGNWTSVTTNSAAQARTANAQNEVTKVGGKSLAYSRTGNLTTDEQGRTLVYDGWNRLAAVQTSDGTEIARYEYDGLNRRITEQVGSPTFAAAVRDVFYSQDWQVLEERWRRTEGVVASIADTRFIWSPIYVDALIARDTRSNARSSTRDTDKLGQRVYALQDANWNTTAIIAASAVSGFTTGDVVSRFVYTPYGQVETLADDWTTLPAGPALFTPWSHFYQGLELTPATGLYQARNREYSATLGRFIQLDPIGFNAGDSNWYRFVGNGPTGATDPSGLAPGFWSDYGYYFTHPWAMDDDLEYGFYAGAAFAIGAGGAAAAGAATGIGMVGGVGVGVGEVMVAAGTLAAHPHTPTLINGIAEAAAGIDGPGLDVGDVARAGSRSAGRCAAQATSAGPKFKNWNDFQAGTKGQFSSRSDAAKAWEAYKDANGIVTATVRSQAAKQQFLRSLADNPNTPSWMKPWLSNGRVPPGYEVDHIKPLSIGGPDTPVNMRLQGTDLHRTHHKYYRPWEW